MPNQVPELRTERLILNALTTDDFAAFAAMWAEPAVARFTTRKVQTGTESWLRIMRGAGFWALLDYGCWAVRERATGVFLGEAGFGDFHRGCTPSHDGIPEMGWVFCPERHGRGYATEAVAAALRWADEEARFPLTVCGVDPENRASLRVAEKNRFVVSGMRRFGEDEVRFLTRARHG